MIHKERKIQRKTRRRKTPVLIPLLAPYPLPLFQTVIEKNRYLFLQYMEKRYHFPAIKPSLWRGTALHLLELSHKISPGMHPAAHHYLEISKKVLQERCPRSASREQPSSRHPYIPLRDQQQDPRAELETETQWRDLSRLLEKESVKAILDRLGDDRDLSMLEYLASEKEALIQLKKGLNLLQTYLTERRT